MAKREKPKNSKKAKRAIVDLLADLEESLIAVGYSFDGVRTSAVPTVFETLLETLRLDGHDIPPIIASGDGDGGAGVKGSHKAADSQSRKRPREQRSAGSINRREWKKWLNRPPRGARGNRIFIRMNGPHAHAGIPGTGKRR